MKKTLLILVVLLLFTVSTFATLYYLSPKPPMASLEQCHRTIADAIEQEADVIMFVYRESVYCEHCRKKDGSCTANHERNAEVIIGKQRNGPIGTVELAFMGEHTRFENLAKGN